MREGANPLGTSVIEASAAPPRTELHLSVIVPCYNEQDSLPAFAERMLAACKIAAGHSFEIIFINDGSRDHTWSIIRELSGGCPQIVGVNLSRNHGHQLAVSAGMSMVRGDWILVIDADLQDPPELLADMMKLAEEGHDVVYARRRARASETKFKLATANLFYRFLNALSEVNIPQDVGDFRLISRRIAQRLNAMPEQDRFIRGMVAWLGGRQTEILYDRDPRYAGKTNYTLAKMVRLAIAGLTGFSTAPLNLAILLAVIGVAIGLAIVIYILVGYFLGHSMRGWSSLALITVFFGVGQFFCIAIIGAYLGRTFVQVKGRPLYLVDEIIWSDGPGSNEA